MENKETTTYTILKKVPYVIAIFPCLFLIKYSRGIINAMLNSIPHDSIINFAFKYIQTGRHELELGFLLIVIIILAMILSTSFLINKFSEDENKGKLLSIILIATNITVIILSVWMNFIMFKIIAAILFICFIFLFLLSGLPSNQN